MFAVTAARISPDDPVAGLELGERAESVAEGRVGERRRQGRVAEPPRPLDAAGVGIRPEQLPIVLGCDAAGLDPDGNEVIVHGLDRRPRLPRRRDDGPQALASVGEARRVRSPRRSSCRGATSCRSPPSCPGPRRRACRPRGSRRTACCSTAPGCARVDRARAGRGRRRRDRADHARPRRRVPGVGDESRRVRSGPARSRSAPTRRSPPVRGCPTGSTPVMETVGAATWAHSVKALKPGGTIVISGATSGPDAARRADPHLLPPAVASSAPPWAPARSSCGSRSSS